MAYGSIKVDNLISTNGTVDLTTITTDEATTSDKGYMSAADKTKLDGIEASATADQTGAEIKALYEAEADTNAFTDADHTKLDGIEAGAEVNVVTSVNTATGAVVLDADDIDDASTTHKFVTAADVTALGTLSSDLAAKADLSGGKLDTSQLPDIAISEYKGAVANQTAMLAVTGEKGDWVIRSDDGKVYIITGTDPSVVGGWTALSYPTAPDTDLSYTASTRVLASSTGTDVTLPEAVASGNSGLLTGSDKAKLDGIETGATADQTKADIDALGIDAATLDGIDSASFLRSDASDSISAADGPILSVTKTGVGGVDATNNHTLLVKNTNANHSWGITGEFRIEDNGNGNDRPSILFSSGFNTTTWSVGYGGDDDNFRINTNHGYHNTSWGTTRFSIDGSGNLYAGELTNKIWHEGNDGAGSGLDADTVDGFEVSQLAKIIRVDPDFTNRWYRLCRTTGNSQGGHIKCILSGTGDFGNASRGAWLIELGNRLGGGVCEVTQLSRSAGTGIPTFRLVNQGSDVFEVWAYLEDYTYVHQLTEISSNAAEMLFDSSTSTDPGGSAVSHHRYLTTADEGAGNGLDADTIDGYEMAAESGPSCVGNFGQWQDHSQYTNFNQPVGYWGWNFVQANANGPNTTAAQWYRNRVSLGDDYGFNYATGDYWLEMAYPRDNRNSAGHMWVRACENGSVGSWEQVGSRIVGDFVATGNVTAYSDINLKENIEVIPDALEKVSAIRGVTYDRKDVEVERQAGVIAQEVEAVLPEVVNTSEDGIKSVAYGNLVSLLIEAVKELKGRVEILEAERN